MVKKATKEEKEESAAVWQVLARKYRPKNFTELKGQEALVRTLTNAIETGRIAHAFMLTGVRGVGKTTTARIIARALNCVGPDGKGGPTPHPCGVCDNCVAISADRHVDVIEMDAASRTGVEDMRGIIDGVQYAPVSGRYKIYIIDEVHMLSKAAFNALLKTLEEPPAHVKFVFATTEIRKVPVTVLSRCQRFDLRRVSADVLKGYFGEVLGKEGGSADDESLTLIARAADGSVRDGLSLLDRAIALEGKTLTGEGVRGMLGLADRMLIFDLFDTIVKGDAEKALDVLALLYSAGAEPVVVLQDMLELTHFITKSKAVPGIGHDMLLPEAERVRGRALSATLSMAILTRMWQMLLKGVGEVQHAAVPYPALEMVILRLIYAAELPTPGDLVRKIQEGGFTSAAHAGSGVPASSPSSRPVINRGGSGSVAHAIANETAVSSESLAVSMPRSFAEAYQVFGQKREAILQSQIHSFVHLVSFEAGRIGLRLAEGAPRGLPNQMAEKLTAWTGQRWVVSVVNAGGDPTLAERDREQKKETMDEVMASPAVMEVMKAFPGAKIIDIKTRQK